MLFSFFLLHLFPEIFNAAVSIMRFFLFCFLFYINVITPNDYFTSSLLYSLTIYCTFSPNNSRQHISSLSLSLSFFTPSLSLFSKLYSVAINHDAILSLNMYGYLGCFWQFGYIVVIITNT